MPCLWISGSTVPSSLTRRSMIWIDCSTVAQPAVPTCYSPFQHPQLAGDGGRTLFITFTRLASYDVVAYEVTLDDNGSIAAATAAAGKGDRR